MSYILIAADFPKTTNEQKDQITSSLEQKYWRKAIDNPSNTPMWYRFFPEDISEETAKNTAVRNFIDSCSMYCEPRLIIHFGDNRPTFHGYPVTSISL